MDGTSKERRHDLTTSIDRCGLIRTSSVGITVIFLAYQSDYFKMRFMGVNVYIFIQVEKGTPPEVAAGIAEIEEVETAHAVTGQYDIIVFAHLGALDSLNTLLTRIHLMEGVQHTQTAICIP